jgi:hypothetical protein
MKTQIDPWDRLPKFDAEMGKKFDPATATLYEYLLWHTEKYGAWTGTMRSLMRVYPFWTAKQLRLSLHKLEDAGEIRRIRKACLSYAVVKPRKPKQAYHTFDPRVTGRCGTLAAIVHDSIGYWINRADDNGEEPLCYCSARTWQRYHDYASLRSVYTAFNALKESGDLVLLGYTDDRQPIWGFPPGGLRRWVDLHTRAGHRAKPSFHMEAGPTIEDPDL